jgi:hypothetical protein
MSTAVGEVHLALCRKYPAWIRILEHLPGINLTWDELTAQRTYYPEYHQWSFYHTETPSRLHSTLAALAARPWSDLDEYFHLNKFCTYFGRYNRSIDPAINMGVHANKYPLHSRLMHYFTPPVQSAMTVLHRRHFVGKFDSLERAAEDFSELGCWEPLWEILHAGYETPGWYQEPQITELEDMLEEGLVAIAAALRNVITLVPEAVGTDVGAWRRQLAEIPVEPAMRLFDGAKFSRLMKGRLRFYANAPAYFDSTWLIQNEVGRIGHSFFRVPFRVFWRLLTDEVVEDPTDILDRLKGDILTEADVAAARAFHRLTSSRCEEGQERQRALAVADVFDDFYAALAKISELVRTDQLAGKHHL